MSALLFLGVTQLNFLAPPHQGKTSQMLVPVVMWAWIGFRTWNISGIDMICSNYRSYSVMRQSIEPLVQVEGWMMAFSDTFVVCQPPSWSVQRNSCIPKTYLQISNICSCFKTVLCLLQNQSIGSLLTMNSIAENLNISSCWTMQQTCIKICYNSKVGWKYICAMSFWQFLCTNINPNHSLVLYP